VRHYQEIFNLTRLNEAIGIFADEAAAAVTGRKLVFGSEYPGCAGVFASETMVTGEERS
jgi:hypothetical protein